MVSNKTLYQDSQNNAIRRSTVYQFEGELLFRGFAAKLVLSGKENYYLQDSSYEVEQGHYIVGNSYTPSESTIKSQQAVQGLCVDISSALIEEVLQTYWENTADFKAFLLGEHFLVNQYPVQQTLLGQQLVYIHQHIQTAFATNPAFNIELFYQLAEAVIQDQYPLFEQRQHLQFKKENTKSQVFRQLLEVKFYLEQHWKEGVSIETMAQKAQLSKYRFIRLFKLAFGLTPYQFQLQKRLEKAALLVQQKKAIQTVAFEVGFSDAFAFSKAFKAFKAFYGCSPSHFAK